MEVQEALDGLARAMGTELDAERRARAEAEARARQAEDRLAGINYVGQMLEQTDRALNELTCWKDVAEAYAKVADADKGVEAAKLVASRAGERYEEVVAEAVSEAYAEGIIDGSNQKQRDTQIDAFLASNESVSRAKDAVAKAERSVLQSEAEREVIYADYKAAQYHFRSAEASANLVSAMLQVLRKVGGNDD